MAVALVVFQPACCPGPVLPVEGSGSISMASCPGLARGRSLRKRAVFLFLSRDRAQTAARMHRGRSSALPAHATRVRRHRYSGSLSASSCTVRWRHGCRPRPYLITHDSSSVPMAALPALCVRGVRRSRLPISAFRSALRRVHATRMELPCRVESWTGSITLGFIKFSHGHLHHHHPHRLHL